MEWYRTWPSEGALKNEWVVGFRYFISQQDCRTGSLIHIYSQNHTLTPKRQPHYDHLLEVDYISKLP